MGKGNNQEQDARLFRFIILLALILIFIAVATQKIWELRIAAERIGVKHNLGAIKSALGIHLSQSVVREGIQALAPFHHGNPMNLLQQQPGDEVLHDLPAGIAPQNYLGEFLTDEAPQESGIWYFDLDQKLLVYRVNFTDHFISSNEEYPHSARYQLQVRFTDANDNGKFDPEQEFASGIDIEAVDHYTWLREPPQQASENSE